MNTTTHVKLCVDPDQVCLQGGCGYCNFGTFKTVEWLRNYAARHGWTTDFNYGFDHGWPNREKKS